MARYLTLVILPLPEDHHKKIILLTLAPEALSEDFSLSPTAGEIK